jgi:TRAP-type C4-dicarboxylate transport system substrate-binding protein
MMKWKEEVEKRTNGQVTVQTFGGGTLLTSKNMYDGVLAGVADIGLSNSTYEPGRFPLISLNDLPGLFSSGVQASQAIYDVISKNPGIAELKDYYVVTAFATEPARIMSIKRYDTVASLKGAEIRTAGGPKVVEVAGGVEVAMPMSEVPQALQTAVVKGVLTSREVLKDFKIAETTKFILEKPLGRTTFLALMRKDKYEALPANVKKVFDDLRAEMAKFAGQTMDDTAKSAVDWAVSTQGNTVVTLSPEENAKFDAVLQPLTGTQIAWVAAKGLPAEDFFKQLQAAAAAFAK